MQSVAAIRVRPSKLRSLVTNQPLRLTGVDGRSSAARRFRDVIDGLLAEYGAAEFARVRELATLKVAQEAVQAAAVTGDTRACEEMVRTSNLISRRERELRAAAAKTRAKGPTLAEYIANKAQR